jgi:hypothetical protein
MRSTPPVDLDEELEAPGKGPGSQIIAADQQSKLISAVRDLSLAYRQPAVLTLEGINFVSFKTL